MKYICQVCGYIYDDEKEKVPFDTLDEDWTCPICGASKSNFTLLEEDSLESVDDLVELNAGEFAAVCSNLARGCEKQYLFEEMKLFKELSQYFDNVTPLKENAKVEDLLELINKDIKSYDKLKDYCISEEDRGAARVSVWGEKVTRMLSSLVNRYLKDGEKFLENTSIWVCSVCGFVYVGENPPDLCPVCKVPSWKFEKMDCKKV